MIVNEVSTLGETVRDLYEEIFTMHKAVVCMLSLQKQFKYFVKTLRNVQATIIVMHEWTMQYKGAPLDLGKKMKPRAELEEERVRMLIWNSKQLT